MMEWMELLKAFAVGGLICVVGQILIDKTKLLSGRILVLFVCLGCSLGGLGLYKKLEEFAGAGATVPLTGFGFRLAEGVIKEVDKAGFLGILPEASRRGPRASRRRCFLPFWRRWFPTLRKNEQIVLKFCSE